jgi:hypothetical protein
LISFVDASGSMNTDRRREFLRGAGVATLAGLAGCVFGGGGSGTPSPGRTYDVLADNRIVADDLAAAYGVDASTTTAIDVTVDRVRDGENELLFDGRAELAPGGRRRFEDAFGTEADGTAYGINATLLPFHEGGRSYDVGFQFAPGEYATPDDATLTVTVVDTREDQVLNPDPPGGRRRRGAVTAATGRDDRS